MEKYNKIFREVFSVSDEELGDSFTFDSVEEWTSIVHMILITKLEDEFDIFFETVDILHYESYKNGIEILRKYGVDI